MLSANGHHAKSNRYSLHYLSFETKHAVHLLSRERVPIGLPAKRSCVGYWARVCTRGNALCDLQSNRVGKTDHKAEKPGACESIGHWLILLIQCVLQNLPRSLITTHDDAQPWGRVRDPASAVAPCFKHDGGWLTWNQYCIQLHFIFLVTLIKLPSIHTSMRESQSVSAFIPPYGFTVSDVDAIIYKALFRHTLMQDIQILFITAVVLNSSGLSYLSHRTRHSSMATAP